MILALRVILSLWLGRVTKNAVWAITAVITAFLRAYELGPCEKAEATVRRFSMPLLHSPSLSSLRGGVVTPKFSFANPSPHPPQLLWGQNEAGRERERESLPVGQIQDIENKGSSSDPLHSNPQFLLEQSWNLNTHQHVYTKQLGGNTGIVKLSGGVSYSLNKEGGRNISQARRCTNFFKSVHC